MFELKNELYKKSITLRNMNLENAGYKKAREIQKEQDKLYKKWLFMEKLDKEMKKNDKSN